MHQKFFYMMFMFLWSFGITVLSAQSLVLKTTTGTEQANLLSNLKKIVFADKNLFIYSVNGPAVSYSLPSVSKLYFSSTITSSLSGSVAETNTAISIFPNPAKDNIYFQNVPDQPTPVSIHRIDGLWILNTQVSSISKAIEVSHLESGVYILRINNQVFKFIKL